MIAHALLDEASALLTRTARKTFTPVHARLWSEGGAFLHP